MTREATAPGTAESLPARAGARPPLRVTHLLLEGELDGIGLHVLDLARAQLDQGSVAPAVVTCPSPGYERRLAQAGIPRAVLDGAGFRAAVSRAAAGALVPACDVLHLHGRRACQLALIARSLPRTSVARHILSDHLLVATCHGWLSDTVRRRVRRWTELRSYAALDLLIASNREQVDTVTALRRRPPTVAYVPNGVAPLPPARYAGFLTRYGVPAGADVVGNVGRLAPEKRQDVFLEACARIVAERPATHAVLLGDGRERQALERLARRLGIADRVHFAGLVEDVPAACAELTLLLHTSDTEGTPRAVVEAMAAGVPVIATAVGGVPDLVDDGRTGVLTQRGDAAALAREAVRLLDQPATRREMGERGRRRAEALFSATTMARRVEDLYRGCLTRPARAVA